MICTVTFNPSLDYIVSVDDFQLGMTNRTSSELILPGGKGINVSIVLKNLGLDSTALGYVAGFTGEELIRRLTDFGVNADFIKINHGMTRINLKLKSIDGTEINGCGPDIDAEALEQLMAYLSERNGTPDDYCITVGYGYDEEEGRRLWMQTRAALRAKYPGAQCEVGLLQIGCTIAVHTGPYALGMGVMRRWKKQG